MFSCSFHWCLPRKYFLCCIPYKNSTNPAKFSFSGIKSCTFRIRHNSARQNPHFYWVSKVLQKRSCKICCDDWQYHFWLQVEIIILKHWFMKVVLWKLKARMLEKNNNSYFTTLHWFLSAGKKIFATHCTDSPPYVFLKKKIGCCFPFHLENVWLRNVITVSFRMLNRSQLKALNIEMLPGYQDPYSSRVLTRGEIGCFLSHYYIWKEVTKICLSSL